MNLTKPSTGDLVAGVSVALVAIPQSLAYAELAGMPAQYGLFASALPSLLAAFFVSSRHLQTGPVALTALLTFGALSPLATPQSAKYIGLAALLALLVGILRVLLGLVRLGSVAYLLSEPVLLGFTSGAAVLIISSQLPKVFDVPTGDDGVLVEAVRAVTSPGDWQWQAIALSMMVWILMMGRKYVHALFPGVLVAVIVGVVISRSFDYGGSTVGDLDGGFITLGLSFPWSSLGDLLVPAIAIALVGFAEPASIARTFATEDRQPWNANREMVSQGVANLAAGVSGAFPVGGSFSRSSLNRLAGATSPWAGAITGAFVLVALPLTPALEALPRAILGAVVVAAVLKLIRVSELADLFRASPIQAVVGFGTLAATLATAPRVERGVLVGIGLSVMVHLYRELRVDLGLHEDGDRLIVRPSGVLWFASAPQFERLAEAAFSDRRPRNVHLDLGRVGRLDYSAAATMARLVRALRTDQVVVTITGASPGVVRSLRVHLEDFGPESHVRADPNPNTEA